MIRVRGIRYCLRWTTLGLVLVTGHIILAPATVALRDRVIVDWKARWAAWQTEAYLEQWRKQPAVCREDFLPCVLAFRDHLEARGMKLRLILRPEHTVLQDRDGHKVHEVTESALAMRAAERQLRKQGVRVVNLLPDLYAYGRRYPDEPYCQPDGHYTPAVVGQIANTLCKSLEDWQKRRGGRSTLLVGDCYATLTAHHLQQGDVIPGVRSQWKNGGDHLMAYEISRLPADLLPEVREIFWIISSDTLLPSSQSAVPLPLPVSGPFPIPQNDDSPDHASLIVKVKVTRATRVPDDLGSGSPYPNAYAIYEVATDGGKTFLVVHSVMQTHVACVGNRWQMHTPLVLSLQPWESAIKERPELAREQLFDDVQDYTSGRYLVTHWLHAP